MNRQMALAAVGLAGGLLAGAALCTAAEAAAISCTSTLVLAGGNGNELDSSLGTGVCVQTADALFGNFNISGLPSGGSIAFNLNNFGSPAVGYHGISFSDNFSQGTYNLGYAVKISQGTNLFASIDGDFTQNNGTSTLVVTTTESGTGSIDWTKVGATGSGPDQINYSPGFTQLDVSETLTDAGAVSAISDSLVENAAAPISEPGSRTLLATAVVGVLALRIGGRRRKVC